MKKKNLGAPDYASIEDRRPTKSNSYLKDHRKDVQLSTSEMKGYREDKPSIFMKADVETAYTERMRKDMTKSIEDALRKMGNKPIKKKK